MECLRSLAEGFLGDVFLGDVFLGDIFWERFLVGDGFLGGVFLVACFLLGVFPVFLERLALDFLVALALADCLTHTPSRFSFRYPGRHLVSDPNA